MSQLTLPALRQLSQSEQIRALNESVRIGDLTSTRAAALGKQLALPEDWRATMPDAAKSGAAGYGEATTAGRQHRPLPPSNPAMGPLNTRPPRRGDQAEAQRLYSGAITLKRGGKIVEALAQLREAIALLPHGASSAEPMKLALAGYLHLAGDAAGSAHVEATIKQPPANDDAYYGYAQNMTWLAGVRGDAHGVARWLCVGTRWLAALERAGVPKAAVDKIRQETKNWVASEPDLAPFKNSDEVRFALDPPTVAQVVNDPRLAALFEIPGGDSLGAFTTEEIVRFARFNLRALLDGTAQAKRVAAHVQFSRGALEQRANVPGAEISRLEQQLLALHHRDYPPLETMPIAEALLAELDAYEKKHGLFSLDGVSDDALLAARALMKFGALATKLEWELGRAPTAPFDAPDFKKKLPNVIDGLVAEAKSFKTPSDPGSVAFVERTKKETVELLRRLARAAAAVDRADIAGSANEVVGAFG